MKTIHSDNLACAYLEGMLWAAYGVKVISCDAVEWQIDAVKECAKELKQKEIEHSSLSPTEKQNQKKLWKQWIDETTRGFKEVQRREGRMEQVHGLQYYNIDEMIRFLQISDIHFTDETGNDDGYKLMKCKFLEDIEECKGLMGKVDRILICGDIAFAGMDNQCNADMRVLDDYTPDGELNAELKRMW